jgi:hypothetical protein
MRRGVKIGFGVAGALLLAAGGVATASWLSTIRSIEATAYQGLVWQATLGFRPYQPGQGGLIQLGSQADLLGRYLALSDAGAEQSGGLVPVAARLVKAAVFSQSVGATGGYVQYLVTEARTFRRHGSRDTATVTGLVTVWVSPGIGRAWTVTGLSYNFDPLSPPTVPPTVSYTATALTPQAASPLGTTGGP